MSRIGRKAIKLPQGVSVTIGEQVLEVKGPKGNLKTPIPDGISFKLEGDELRAERTSDDQAPLHGLARALANNAIVGVTEGFSKQMDVVGVGYKADVQAKRIVFSLGYSHPIELLLPDGVDLKIEKQTQLQLSGFDRQLIGQVAANIRALRKPDPYKNKGIRYKGELLRKKVGKTGASAK